MELNRPAKEIDSGLLKRPVKPLKVNINKLPKKEIKMKNAISFDNLKNSGVSDPRPIRDPGFVKDIKEKIIRFLVKTEFSTKIDVSLFKKLTQANVKSIFEHFIKVFDADFQINDSSSNFPTPEDRMINFFTAFQYRNNFSKTHIISPTILSSTPFLVAAFDFLRRLCTAHINTHAAMMFPPLRADWDHSIEVVVDQLVSVFLHNTDENRFEHFVSDFQNAVGRVAGIEAGTELARLNKQVAHIEQILTKLADIKSETGSMMARTAGLESLIEETQLRLENAQRQGAAVLVDLGAEQLGLENDVASRTRLEGQKEKFEEIGYGYQIRQIDDHRGKIDVLRVRRKQVKTEIEMFNNDLRSIHSEIDNIKFNLQRESTDIFNMFPGLIDKEMQEIIEDLRVEHIIKYDCGLRVHVIKIMNGINVEIKAKKEEVEKQKKIADQVAVEIANVNKEIEMLDLEQTMLEELIEKRESILLELDKEISADAKEMQVLFNEIESEKLEIEELEQGVERAQKELEDEKRMTADVRQFYEADEVFRKRCAEIRLQSLQDTWKIRRSIMEEQISYEKDEELKKSTIEKFDLELNDCFQKELDTLDEFFL